MVYVATKRPLLAYTVKALLYLYIPFLKHTYEEM